MDDIPELAGVAGLIGDRARAAILLALMGGQALTAGELARAARVTKQTASAHLAKLLAARLLADERAGRHRYFRLADHQVAAAVESLTRLAHRGTRAAAPAFGRLAAGGPSVTAGPADAALRKARTCYDHLAGELGVLVFDSMAQRELVRVAGRDVQLTAQGEQFCRQLGIDVGGLRRARRPMCLACLDWTHRRHHLAGALGAAVLDRTLALGWARRTKGSRALFVPVTGERALRARFPAAAPPL